MKDIFCLKIHVSSTHLGLSGDRQNRHVFSCFMWLTFYQVWHIKLAVHLLICQSVNLKISYKVHPMLAWKLSHENHALAPSVVFKGSNNFLVKFLMVFSKNSTCFQHQYALSYILYNINI